MFADKQENGKELKDVEEREEREEITQEPKYQCKIDKGILTAEIDLVRVNPLMIYGMILESIPNMVRNFYARMQVEKLKQEQMKRDIMAKENKRNFFNFIRKK